jgi:hypothetical protein
VNTIFGLDSLLQWQKHEKSRTKYIFIRKTFSTIAPRCKRAWSTKVEINDKNNNNNNSNNNCNNNCNNNSNNNNNNK